jgi:hypothetical protein
MFSTKVAEKNQNIHFIFSNLKKTIMPMWDNVEQFCRVIQTIDGNIAHAHCMLDTYGCKHALGNCNTYWLSTATIVA